MKLQQHQITTPKKTSKHYKARWQAILIYCVEFHGLFFSFVRDEEIYRSYEEHLKLAISATLSSTYVYMLRYYVLLYGFYLFSFY